MKRTFATVLSAFCALLIAGCAGAEQAAENPSPPVQPEQKGALEFSLRLYNSLSDAEKGNLFFSPASTQTALAMTYAGAAGETATEMARVLAFNPDPVKNTAEYSAVMKKLNTPLVDHDIPVYQLSAANALWANKEYPFNATFLNAMKASMDVKIENLDFSMTEAARKTINDWVVEQTQQHIQDLIPEGAIDAKARLILINAVYFKSYWDYFYFKKEDTKKGVFHAPEGDIETDLMHTNWKFIYAEDERCQVIEIPYKQKALSFLLVLPRQSNGLPALEKSLTPEMISGWYKPVLYPIVDLTLPKFKIESSFELSSAFAKMGMPLAFSEKADFSGMLAPTRLEPLYIGNVIQKSFIALDEKGTEASGRTVNSMHGGVSMEKPEHRTVTADHPFLFIIRHRETGTVLFMGRVSNPSK